MPEMVFTKTFRAGEEIFRIGEPGSDAYIVQSGAVEVAAPSNGQKRVIARLERGEIFGEMSMIDDAPRSATVTALEDTELVVIHRDRIMQPMRSADPLMNMMLRVILTRFRDAQGQLIDLRAEQGGPDPTLDEVRDLVMHRITVERDMRKGLSDTEFELHYQPIVDLEAGHIVGFEALMRWRKSNGERPSPMEFIPLAEETGLIVELGRMALAQGLKDQAIMAEAFARIAPDLPAPFMSVNVSGLQFSQLSEIDMLADIIQASNVEPTFIKLEMTESLLIEEPEHAAQALERLKGLGVSIAIDDFGTGYSSLSYLHQFPFDTLKIDRAFVNNMDRSENSARIVNGIAQLGHALDMKIVAEGIEETKQVKGLLDLGCHYGQGYHMAKPAPLDETLALIENGTSLL